MIHARADLVGSTNDAVGRIDFADELELWNVEESDGATQSRPSVSDLDSAAQPVTSDFRRKWKS